VVACTPHPGLGAVQYEHVRLDLATCKSGSPVIGRPADGVVRQGHFVAEVRASGRGKTAGQTIWVTDTRTRRSHAVFSETEYYTSTGPGETPGPIVLLGWSSDAKWIFFTIDPGSSASIMADGLTLRVVSAEGGAPHRLAPMLVYSDYLAWCGGRLVFTAGWDRIAINDKHLDVASPPDWKVRPLVRAPGRSFGSLVCSPDRRSVVVQSQPSGTDARFFATRWSLWRVGLDGSTAPLTRPPAGHADESPRYAGNVLYFVRSERGRGVLFALQGSKLLGPLLALGYSLGYYGHQDWPYTVTR
jgi:hypothetical protein